MQDLECRRYSAQSRQLMVQAAYMHLSGANTCSCYEQAHDCNSLLQVSMPTAKCRASRPASLSIDPCRNCRASYLQVVLAYGHSLVTLFSGLSLQSLEGQCRHQPSAGVHLKRVLQRPHQFLDRAQGLIEALDDGVVGESTLGWSSHALCAARCAIRGQHQQIHELLTRRGRR